MTNRREFLEYSGAAALLASLLATAAQSRKTPPRLIPGTDAALPVIGLGNSAAFREADSTAAAGLLDLFLEHGGGLPDAATQKKMLDLIQGLKQC